MNWLSRKLHVDPKTPAPAGPGPRTPATIAAAWPERWREAWEERAAVMEYDGGLARADAERRALVSVVNYAAELGIELKGERI